MRHLRTTGPDRGVVTPFAVIIASALLLVAGLVHDGGLILAERREAGATAAAAARAGAQAIDVGAARASVVRLDPAAAQLAAQQYLARVGHTGTVTIVDDTITVEVASTVDMHFLGLVGISSRDVTGTGTARATRGISEADQ